MHASFYSSVFLCALSVFPGAHAAAISKDRRAYVQAAGILHTPIEVISNTVLGRTKDNNFNPHLFRDGGGGGFVNGYHVITFADSFTGFTSDPYANNNTSFYRNSVAYMLDSSNPTHLSDWGSLPHADLKGYRTLLTTGLRPIAGSNETNNQAIWPNSNMVPLHFSTNGLAVYDVHDITQVGYPVLYNTMAQFNVQPLTAGEQINVTRVVPRLFYANENRYGSFCIYRQNFRPGEPYNDWLYLFSASSVGIKAARVYIGNRTMREHYTYWNGETWSSHQPAVDSTTANLIPYSFQWNLNGKTGVWGPGTGEVFWSPYFQTFVCVFLGDGFDDGWYIAYSLSQKIEGPWTYPETNSKLNGYADYDWPCNNKAKNNGLIYAGHTYSDWDQTGKTLLLSWAICNNAVKMSTLTFA